MASLQLAIPDVQQEVRRVIGLVQRKNPFLHCEQLRPGPVVQRDSRMRIEAELRLLEKDSHSMASPKILRKPTPVHALYHQAAF